MRVYYNEDSSHFCYILDDSGIDPTIEVAEGYIEGFRNTDVTDFVMNVNATTATFDSKVMQSYLDKYEATEENGIKVNYKNTYIKPAYDMFRVKGYDYFQVWIKHLRDMNITPWMSIRMNDAHCLLEDASVTKGEFTTAHPELWRVTEKKADGYYDRCLNYLKLEVRTYMLSFIEEVLKLYDVDGLELDFTREIYCFPIGMEWKGRPVINDFLMQIKALIRETEQYRGHSIKLSVLMWETPSVNYQLGFDVYHWIREGMVDMIVPIVRWDTAWFDMPIDEWKVLTKGTSVEIAAGQQELISAYPGAKKMNSTVDMAFGQAAANISKGADAVYLYNYMAWGAVLDDYGWGSKGDITQQENLNRILHNIGSIEKISRMRRTCVLSYSDNAVYWNNISNRLPLDITSGTQGQYFRICTGTLLKENAELIIGVQTKIEMSEAFTVYCNGKPTEYCGRVSIDPDFNQPELEYHKFKLNVDGSGVYQILQLYSMIDCRVHWAEIVVTPKNIELRLSGG